MRGRSVTSTTSRAAAFAAAYLAVGLGMVVHIMLVLEPAMGFTGPADYMNPDKIAANAGSTSWLLFAWRTTRTAALLACAEA